jgi:hypothetical protein
MKIKLLIIGAVIITGFIMFMPSMNIDLFPEPPATVGAVKSDLKVLQNSTMNIVTDGVDDSLDFVNDKIDDLKGSVITKDPSS